MHLRASLLYPSRHPDFARKSSPGGLPYGALGRGMISFRERRRDPVVVLVAEPVATHSQETCLSLHGHSPKPTAAVTAAAGSTPADSVVGVDGRETFRPVPSTPHKVNLSLLTQARIPS